MSRTAKIEALKKQMLETDKRTREAAGVGHASSASYYGAHLGYYQALINEIKLDDISERLQLIETALGLISQGKHE